MVDLIEWEGPGIKEGESSGGKGRAEQRAGLDNENGLVLDQP